MEALFEDGATWIVAELTQEDWLSTAAADEHVGDSTKPSSAKLRIFWVGEHVLSHHRIMVKERTDRVPLVAIYEQSAQILQVNSRDFADVEEAGSFMIEVAKLYAQRLIELAALKQHRNDEMAKRGHGKKRPATQAPRVIFRTF